MILPERCLPLARRERSLGEGLHETRKQLEHSGSLWTDLTALKQQQH